MTTRRSRPPPPEEPSQPDTPATPAPTPEPDPVVPEPEVPAETQPDTSAEADYSTDTQAMDETGRVVHGQPDLSIDINHNGSGSLDASAVAGADGSLSLTIPSIAVDSDRITAAKNDLSGSLTSITDTVSGLSSDTNNNLQALINDIRAITAQMNKIGQTLSGASQNVTTDTDDLINDVSDEDTEEDVEGKVTNCINEGNVNADINAGGITGAMARENDLDPEDDFTIDGSQSLNFTFKSRVVVRDCTNYGTVTAKKENAGGIVGSMEMGSAISCYGFGAVDAEDAKCVGGVAGSSKSIVRESGSKCRLSGSKQVGGIVGSGKTVENCRAMVVIRHCHRADGCHRWLCGGPAGRRCNRQHLRGRGLRRHRRRELRWHRRADEL